MNPYYQDEWVTIYHGDCREILPELPKVDLVLTDPPYVGLEGGVNHWSYGGVAKNYRKYDTICDPWGADFEWVMPAWEKCKLGMLIFCSYHNVAELRSIINVKPIALICWYKRNSPPAIRNVPHHTVEFIWALQKQSGLEWGNLKTHYDIPKLATGCMATERFVDKDGCAIHPTQKPELLISNLLKCTKAEHIILDPFLGSGTTAYCAKKLNRKCIGIEIEEKYCEIAANRCRQMVFDFSAQKGEL